MHVLLETGIAGRSGVPTLHSDRATCPQGGDRAGHRYAMVAVGVDGAAAKSRTRGANNCEPVGRGLRPHTDAFNSSTVVATRSVSLTRSSAASENLVLPSAKAAATDSTGTSSIRDGTSGPPTSVAINGPAWT